MPDREERFKEIYSGLKRSLASGFIREYIGEGNDQLVDDIAIIGTQEECQDRIRAYGEAGITTHIISCVSGKHAQATYNAFTGNQFSV